MNNEEFLFKGKRTLGNLPHICLTTESSWSLFSLLRISLPFYSFLREAFWKRRKQLFCFALKEGPPPWFGSKKLKESKEKLMEEKQRENEQGRRQLEEQICLNEKKIKIQIETQNHFVLQKTGREIKLFDIRSFSKKFGLR